MIKFYFLTSTDWHESITLSVCCRLPEAGLAVVFHVCLLSVIQSIQDSLSYLHIRTYMYGH